MRAKAIGEAVWPRGRAQTTAIAEFAITMLKLQSTPKVGQPDILLSILGLVATMQNSLTGHLPWSAGPREHSGSPRIRQRSTAEISSPS